MVVVSDGAGSIAHHGKCRRHIRATILMGIVRGCDFGGHTAGVTTVVMPAMRKIFVRSFQGQMSAVIGVAKHPALQRGGHKGCEPCDGDEEESCEAKHACAERRQATTLAIQK